MLQEKQKAQVSVAVLLPHLVGACFALSLTTATLGSLPAQLGMPVAPGAVCRLSLHIIFPVPLLDIDQKPVADTCTGVGPGPGGYIAGDQAVCWERYSQEQACVEEQDEQRDLCPWTGCRMSALGSNHQHCPLLPWPVVAISS